MFVGTQLGSSLKVGLCLKRTGTEGKCVSHEKKRIKEKGREKTCFLSHLNTADQSGMGVNVSLSGSESCQP